MLYMGQMRWLTLWSSSTLFPLLPFQYVWRLSDAFFYANYYYLNRNIPFVNNPRKLQFCSISVSYLYLYHSWRCKWHMHKNFCVGPKKPFRVKRIIKVTLSVRTYSFHCCLCCKIKKKQNNSYNLSEQNLVLLTVFNTSVQLCLFQRHQTWYPAWKHTRHHYTVGKITDYVNFTGV